MYCNLKTSIKKVNVSRWVCLCFVLSVFAPARGQQQISTEASNKTDEKSRPKTIAPIFLHTSPAMEKMQKLSALRSAMTGIISGL